jgi:hypothetical protein
LLFGLLFLRFSLSFFIFLARALAAFRIHSGRSCFLDLTFLDLTLLVLVAMFTPKKNGWAGNEIRFVTKPTVSSI